MEQLVLYRSQVMDLTGATEEQIKEAVKNGMFTSRRPTTTQGFSPREVVKTFGLNRADLLAAFGFPPEPVAPAEQSAGADGEYLGPPQE